MKIGELYDMIVYIHRQGLSLGLKTGDIAGMYIVIKSEGKLRNVNFSINFDDKFNRKSAMMTILEENKPLTVEEVLDMIIDIKTKGIYAGLQDEETGQLPICTVIDGNVKNVNFNIELVKSTDGAVVLMEKKDKDGLIIVNN